MVGLAPCDVRGPTTVIALSEGCFDGTGCCGPAARGVGPDGALVHGLERGGSPSRRNKFERCDDALPPSQSKGEWTRDERRWFRREHPLRGLPAT